MQKQIDLVQFSDFDCVSCSFGRQLQLEDELPVEMLNVALCLCKQEHNGYYMISK